jgi:hypothetical protein
MLSFLFAHVLDSILLTLKMAFADLVLIEDLILCLSIVTSIGLRLVIIRIICCIAIDTNLTMILLTPLIVEFTLFDVESSQEDNI